MIDFLWTIFEISVNIYQSFMALYFVYAFLGGQGIKGFFKPKSIAFAFIYTVAICLENYLFSTIVGKYAYVFAAIYVTILIIYSVFVQKSSLVKGIFAAVMANVIFLLSSALCGNVTAIIFGERLEYLMTHSCVERFIAIITTQLLVFYMVFISLKLFRQSNTSGEDSLFGLGIVSAVLVISIIIGAYINYAVAGNHDKLGLFSIFIFMCVVITNILVCRLLFDLMKNNQAVNELNLLRQTQEYNRQYIENLHSEYETVKKLRHDYKDSFLMLSTLLENKDIEKAKEEISKVVGAIAETELFINTDNAVVNAVVNSKLSTAKARNIECECYVVKDISDIDDIDLCRLLSNMLDNAITACKVVPDGEKQLVLSILGTKISYMFTVKNTISNSVLEINPELKSTKDNASEHGYGIKIIREIADKYSGRSNFYEEDGMFCCSVCLRKNETI